MYQKAPKSSELKKAQTIVNQEDVTVDLDDIFIILEKTKYSGNLKKSPEVLDFKEFVTKCKNKQQDRSK